MKNGAVIVDNFYVENIKTSSNCVEVLGSEAKVYTAKGGI